MFVKGTYPINNIQAQFEKKLSLAIREIADYFIQACAKQIEPLTYRGQLLQNLRIDQNEPLVKSVISDTPYSAALNFGRQPGKMPPVKPLEEWFRLKIHLTPEEAKKAAWALATKFKNEGMEGKHFFTTAALETMNPDVITGILRKHFS
jgi:hypothetical protein